MNIRIVNKKEKKEILRELERNFGINIRGYVLLKNRKFHIFSGNLKEKDIEKMEKEIRIERIGMVVFKKENFGIRLSFDLLNLLKPTKSIMEISDFLAKMWLSGKEIEIKNEKLKKEKERKVTILKNKNDFIGCGYVKEGKIKNFVPKERRVFK